MQKKETTQKLYKSIPSSEKEVGITCITENEVKYRITTHKTQNKHTLWKYGETNIEKIATADSPYDLYDLIPWRNKK